MSTKDYRVAAVVIAFNRDDLLARALSKICEQTTKLNEILVVDNAKLETTKTLVHSFNAKYLEGDPSFGSAGGFALGMRHCLNQSYDFIWTLDDDGYPSSNCLSVLLRHLLMHNLDLVSPLSVAIEDKSQSANVYNFGLRRVTNVAYIRRKQIRFNKSQFYNGVLFSRNSILEIGLPKQELFLRGDELDFYYRARKAKLKMGLVSSAIFFHPSSQSEFPNSRQSLFGVIIPKSEVKKYYQYRNRGYLIRHHNLFFHALYDWIRYPFFFLIFPGRNFKSFIEWKKLWIMGFRGDLPSFEKWLK
jgi:rhamnopyranosyl-N-acetylglucosaminyl-diphospho-decaprenol beta-1,3/1,4-galactofuranosyltransferase